MSIPIHKFRAVFKHAWLSTHLAELTGEVKDGRAFGNILCSRTLQRRITYSEFEGTYADALAWAVKLDEYPDFAEVCKNCLARLESLSTWEKDFQAAIDLLPEPARTRLEPLI